MIEIHFQKGGFVKVTPTGYKGEMCHKATAPYMEKFGGKQTVVPTETETVKSENKQQQQAGN